MGGAHGIVATPDGQFLAPLGTEGILCIDVSGDAGPRLWTEHSGNAEHDYYSLRYLSSDHERSTLVCAARTDGLVTIPFEIERADGKIAGLTAPGVDFIDVCSLRSSEYPYAVAALCHDGSLIFVLDATTYEHKQTLRFNGFKGTPYSILSAQGHIFVLTSAEMIVMPKLASRYLNREALDRPLHYLRKPVTAVEAFIHRDRDLMVVVDDGVDFFEISRLANLAPAIDGIQGNTEIVNWNDQLEAPSLIPLPWTPLVA
jgi:hypothetical protein